MLDKPGLLYWANKIGLEGVKLSDYRKKSTEDGTSLHNQIRDFVLHKKPIQDPLLKKNFNEFTQKVELIDVEQKIETEYFIGRYDVKFSYNNKTYITDFKSSDGIYFETKLQLCAYKMAHPECFIGVTNIPSMITTPIQLDFNKGKEILICLSKIYQLKNEL